MKELAGSMGKGLFSGYKGLMWLLTGGGLFGILFLGHFAEDVTSVDPDATFFDTAMAFLSPIGEKTTYTVGLPVLMGQFGDVAMGTAGFVMDTVVPGIGTLFNSIAGAGTAVAATAALAPPLAGITHG